MWSDFRFASVLCISFFIHLTFFKNQCVGLSSGDYEEPPPEIFTLDATTKIYMAYNSSANQVATLDYNANISAIYNGNSGAVFGFCFETGEFIYIPGGSSPYAWYNSEKNFKDYFGHLPPQKYIFDYGRRTGIVFDKLSITPEISRGISDSLTPLSTDYSNPMTACDKYVGISKTISDILKSPLHGFEGVMGNVLHQYRGDFKFLTGIFQGMAALFEGVDGGIDILNQKKHNLDLGKILTEPTGFHVLIYFLTEMTDFDIGEIMGGTLNSPTRFFPLIDKLGGDVDYGFDGFIHVISELLLFVKGQCTKKNVEALLHNFYSNPKTDFVGLLKELPATIQALLTAVEKLNLVKQLPGLMKTLTNILTNQWYEDGVNMSVVITMVGTNSALKGTAEVDQVLKYIEASKASPQKNAT